MVFATSSLPTGPSYLPGLRETTVERTNVALANAGAAGTIRMRVSFVADGASFSREAVLAPGEWKQWNAPLAAAGMSAADAVVERIEGSEPYAAYATIVDNGTGDGSYLPARALPAGGPQWIPAVVEANGFETEVVLHNPTDLLATASLTFTDSLDPSSAAAGSLEPLVVTLQPHRSVAIPHFVEALRSAGIAVGPWGVPHAGVLRVAARDAGGLTLPILAWGRTSIPAAGGGAYGVAYPSVGEPDLARTEAWVAGLVTDYRTRANFALLNTGAEPVTLEWRVTSSYGADEGITGTVELRPGEWRQESLTSIVADRNASVRVRKVAGSGPFAAYGVLNDGRRPYDGTGDGTYLPMVGVR